MNKFQNKSQQKIFFSILILFLTVFYSFFIHDLLTVSWQKFVDFFFLYSAFNKFVYYFTAVLSTSFSLFKFE